VILIANNDKLTAYFVPQLIRLLDTHSE